MSFPARHPGTCSDCGYRFHTNDLIRRADDDEGWAHDTCTDTDRPDPEPCTRCWLTVCDCDRGT